MSARRDQRSCYRRFVFYSWRALAPVWLAIIVCTIGLAQTLDRDELRRTVSAQIENWSGGEVQIAGPVTVTIAPPGIQLQNFAMRGSDLPLISRVQADRARVSLALGQLLFGRIQIGSITLQAAHIHAVAAKTRRAGRPLSDLLTSTPFEKLYFVDSTIAIRDAEGSGHAVTQVNGKMEFDGWDGVTAKGTLNWRGEMARVVIAADTIVQREGGVGFPLRWSVDSDLLQAAVSGRAEITDTFSMIGEAEFASPSLRDLMRWAGRGAPEGDSLRGFEARGTLAWMGNTLALDDGRFQLDGNSADGALSLAFGGDRPLIQGTLAFDTLSLQPYLDASVAHRLDLPLIYHFDADLRLSARTVTARAIAASDAAMTLNASDGVLVFDLADISLCSGAIAGRLRLDARRPLADVSFRGESTGVDTDSCLGCLSEAWPATGRGNIAVDLSGQGRSAQEVFANLTGKVQGAVYSGSLALDLRGLLSHARGREGDAAGRTEFSRLFFRCGFEGGKVRCERIRMTTAIGVLTGNAEVWLDSMHLNGRLTLGEQVIGASKDFDFTVGGSWTSPTFSPAFQSSGVLHKPVRLEMRRHTLLQTPW